MASNDNYKEIAEKKNSFSSLNASIIDSAGESEKNYFQEIDKLETFCSKPEKNDGTIFIEGFDITPDKSSGVLKKLVEPGIGDEYAGVGDRVIVHYTGWLLNNNEKPKIFDSSRERAKCEFTLGKGMVIKGWDLGIATMKKGEVALFVCQPQYAYGALGDPPKVPPYATVLFEVELFGWVLEDLSPKKDGGVLRKVIYKGEGTSSPNEGAYVKIQIILYFEESIFEEREVDFILGEGCNKNIPEGIEIALLKFRLNEKSFIYIKNKYAFDLMGVPPDNKLSEESLKYEVTLLNFVKVKDVWEMNSDEKLEAAIIAKAKGVNYFKAGIYKVALKQFKLIATYLENEPGVSLDDKESRETLLLTGFLNVALCNLKLNIFIEAIKACNKALNVDPESEKALFRRGQARMCIDDCEEALQDFERLCLYNPNNKAARNCVTLCQEKVKKQKLKDKSIYNKMFEKFVKQDEEKLRNMKTETGTWDEEARKAKDLYTIDSRTLLDSTGTDLSELNLIKLTDISDCVNSKVMYNDGI